MTPEERAKQFVLSLPKRYPKDTWEALTLSNSDTILIKKLESVIRAAVAEAYEDLAKKAEELDLDGHYLRAYDIRVRAKEVLGGGHDTDD